MPHTPLTTAHPAVSSATPGIYLHIPYCKSKCRYCSFNSLAGRDAEIPAYLAALDRQMKTLAAHPFVRGKKFATLFIGGGTPTICSGRELAALITSCLSTFSFTPRPEITVETNPNTVTLAKLSDLRRAGANRLSIGVQSFAASELRMLGRTHSADEACDAFRLARQAGFANISLDLMYGLPGQTAQSWQQTLSRALDLAPDHFSLYELMVEEATELAVLLQQKKLQLPSEQEVEKMDATTASLLENAGYERYEISNYARPGFACRHNINYWENGSWLGIGAGATGSFAGMKFTGENDSARYIARTNQGITPCSAIEGLCRETLFRETMIMGLRMLQGISLQGLAERFDLTPAAYYGKTLERLVAQDLLVTEGDRLRLSEKALPLANQVLAQLV